jgi:hypothetical protein
MLRVRSRLTETRKAFGHLDCGMGNRGLRVCKEFSALVLVTIMMSGCAATVVTPQSKVDIRVQLYGSGAVYGSGSQGQYAPPAKLLEFGTHADSGSMPGVAVTGAAGAAIGAGVGGAMGMSRQRQAEQQYQQGVQQAGTKNQQTRETFDLAHRTCMEAKGYKIG